MTTPPGRTPSWTEIEQFCSIDGWTHVRSTRHSFWQKTLASGEVLETHASFAGSKTMSPGRFSAILRTQLKVSRAEFWDALRTGQPVPRPSANVEPPEPQHAGWVVQGLTARGIPLREIEQMSPDEAEAALRALWAQPP